MLRVLRGDDLELVSREVGVTAAALSGWRDSFLAAGAGTCMTCCISSTASAASATSSAD